MVDIPKFSKRQYRYRPRVFVQANGEVHQQGWGYGKGERNFQAQRDLLLEGNTEDIEGVEASELIESIKESTKELLGSGGIFDSEGRWLFSYFQMLEIIIAGCSKQKSPHLLEVDFAKRCFTKLDKSKLCPYTRKFYDLLIGQEDTAEATQVVGEEIVEDEEKFDLPEIRYELKRQAVQVLKIMHSTDFNNPSGKRFSKEDIQVFARVLKIADIFLSSLTKKSLRGKEATGIHYIIVDYLRNSELEFTNDMERIIGNQDDFNRTWTTIEPCFLHKATLTPNKHGKFLGFYLGSVSRDNPMISKLLAKIIRRRFLPDRDIGQKIEVGQKSVTIVSIIKAILSDELGRYK